MNEKRMQRKRTLEFAHEYATDKGCMPILIGEYIYEYFSQSVAIVRAEQGSLQVVVESRRGQRTEAELEEIELDVS